MTDGNHHRGGGVALAAEVERRIAVVSRPSRADVVVAVSVLAVVFLFGVAVGLGLFRLAHQ